MSPQQKRLWMLQQSDGQIYESCCRLLLRGPLDRQRLQRSLSAIVTRHEILRTTFRRLPGMTIPAQVVEDSFDVDLPLQKSTPSGAVEPDKPKLETENSGAVLEQQPLLQVQLIGLSADEHELLISTPALCADFVTFTNLLSELSQAYAGPAYSSLGEALQYADVAEWQNQVLESTERTVGRDYWRDVSSSLPSVGRRLRREKSFSWSSRPVQIAPDLARKILGLAERAGVVAESVLLACWQILLWRLNLEDEIAVGVYSAGRNYEELVRALGLFAKYLPVTCHLESASKFSDVLNVTHRRLADMRMFEEHYILAGETAGDEATVPRLFAYGFDFLPWPESRAVEGLVISMKEADARFERFDLKLCCVHKGADLAITLEHDPAVFNRSEVAFIAEQMAELLKSVVDQPTRAIRDLNMLSEFEREKLMIEWNHPPAERVSRPLVHEMFDRQVKRKPNALAVICGNEQLSYGELDERARQLAAYLRQLGVGTESRVAICMRRTVSLVVAVLGVLKSGAAYLPLDPSFPQKRLNFMIEDASAEILLTEESLHLAFEAPGAKVIRLDTDWLKIVGVNDPQSIDANRVDPENSAYLIYTSGSTGNPKAVLIEHRQLANYVHSVVERLELESVNGMGNVSTLATDLGNTAIFSSLCSGGCLHLVPQALVNDAGLFWAYVERHKIEALKIVPSHLALLLEDADEQRLVSLNLLVLGGEAAEWELIDRVRKLNPRCRVFNHYGPTETTIGVLTYNVREAEPAGESTAIPLGKSLRNVTAYVLDARMRLVNVGMAGELYIGGAAVGRGYFGRADLTAERFVPNPFDLARGGGRLYRTGDMARFRADGNIEFLGRLDNQVKIRGHRVELGEIEAALRQYPTVRAAVVRNGVGSSPGGSLTGYVVLENNSDEQDLGPALRHFLEDRLLQHMIPSAFVILDRLPLTASGKIDFASLPPPVSDTHYVAPRSRVEEIMAGIWQQVLGVERVGVFDNFFDRGGHSISATRLVTRVRQAFQVDIEVVSVFESPTIASFVVALAQRLVEQAPADQVTDLIDELEASDAPSARLQRL